MPKPKPISQILGNGRGAFRKAFLSVLLHSHVQKDAFEKSLEELGHRCIYCGISEKNVSLQPDHLWPETLGGLHIIGNIVPSCPTCNSKRGSQNWRSFIRTDRIILKKRTQKDIETQIRLISNYMKKYDTVKQPNINTILNKKETKLREDLDIVLNAISQGFREKIRHPQEKDKQFKNSRIMIDKIIKIAKNHLL